MSAWAAAAFAFAFHVPGLRIFTSLRPSRATLIANAIAVAATLAASALAWALLGWPGAIGAFSIGHFAWSFWLAHRAYNRVTVGDERV